MGTVSTAFFLPVLFTFVKFCLTRTICFKFPGGFIDRKKRRVSVEPITYDRIVMNHYTRFDTKKSRARSVHSCNFFLLETRMLWE